MSYAYVVTNALAGLAASAFTMTPAPSDLTTRAYLNDGRMSRQVVGATAATSHTIDVDLGSAQALVGFALLNHNACGLDYASDNYEASVVITATDNADYVTSSVVAKAATSLVPWRNLNVNANNCDHVLQFVVVTKRYWRITITTTSGVLKVGELFAFGTAASPVRSLTRGSAYGSGEGEEVIAVSTQFQSGEQRVVKLGGPVLERRYSWSDFTASQADELRRLWRTTNGPVTPLLWVDAYESVQTAGTAAGMRCIYGRLQTMRFDVTQDDYGVFQPPGFVIRSMGREMGA